MGALHGRHFCSIFRQINISTSIEHCEISVSARSKKILRYSLQQYRDIYKSLARNFSFGRMEKMGAKSFFLSKNSRGLLTPLPCLGVFAHQSLGLKRRSIFTLDEFSG